MELESVLLVWAAVAAAAGGALNVVVSRDYRFWPSVRWDVPGSRVVRPGLLLGAVAGAGPAGLLVVIGHMITGAATSVYTIALLVAGSLSLGFVVSRWLTSEMDKRLLRAALRQACAAPAASPDVVRAVLAAAPQRAYELASEMMPRPLTFHRDVARTDMGPSSSQGHPGARSGGGS